MRFQRLLFVVAFAGGCDFGADDAAEDTGGPGIGANMPAWCEEVSRVAVSDTSLPAEGFAFAADDAIAALAGTFAGELVTYDANGDEAGRAPLQLVLTAGGVDAVSTVLVDPAADDPTTDGPPMGAPEQQDAGGCAPFYEISAIGHLSAGDGLLDESVSVKLRVIDAAQGSFTASIALAELHGTAVPPAEIAPSDWDAVGLSVDAYLESGAWIGTVTWQASNEDTGGTYTYDTATGVGTGTVEVSGMSATLGSFSAARP